MWIFNEKKDYLVNTYKLEKISAIKTDNGTFSLVGLRNKENIVLREGLRTEEKDRLITLICNKA